MNATPPGSSVHDYVHAGAEAVFADIAVTNPPAGKDWSFTVPGGRWFRLVAGRALLTTDAVAGTRGHAMWQVKDGDGLVRARGMHYLEIGEKKTYTVIYGVGFAAEITEDETTRLVRAPSMWIPAGWSVGSAVLTGGNPGLDAGDQFSQIRLWAEMPYDTGHELASAMPDWVEVGLAHAP